MLIHLVLKFENLASGPPKLVNIGGSSAQLRGDRAEAALESCLSWPGGAAFLNALFYLLSGRSLPFLAPGCKDTSSKASFLDPHGRWFLEYVLTALHCLALYSSYAYTSRISLFLNLYLDPLCAWHIPSSETL